VYLGAWALPNDAAFTLSTQNLTTLENVIGRPLAISMHYDGLTDVFPSPQEAADLQAGRIPLISLNCNTTNASIAAGSQDAALIAKADAIKATGKPVFLRYLWEFNDNDTANGRTGCIDPATDVGGYFSAPEFIAAYQHIHNVMLARGATNIAWIWNPGGGGTNGLPYYPGDAYVDWVGMDVYDRGSFQTSVFATPYAQYAHVGNGTHPVIIAETGAVASDQVAFFNSAVPALQSQYPDIKALVYFDAAGPQGNYSLTPAGLAAFKQFASNPYMQAALPQ